MQRGTHSSPRALAASALVHTRLCCTVSKAKLLQGASSRTEGLCFCLFVLPATPNPCHRVSTWVNTCPHSPVEVPWLDSQHISPWGMANLGVVTPGLHKGEISWEKTACAAFQGLAGFPQQDRCLQAGFRVSERRFSCLSSSRNS